MKKIVRISLYAGATAYSAVLIALACSKALPTSGLLAMLGRDRAAGAFRARDEPVAITPHRLADLADREEIETLLRTLDPMPLPGGDRDRVPTAMALHALRLWGGSGYAPAGPRGSEASGHAVGRLAEVLLDNEAFRDSRPGPACDLLVRSPRGVRVTRTEDDGPHAEQGETHFGKLVQVMAEIGMPSSRRVTPADRGPATLRDVIADAAARLTLDDELEFVACGLGRYARDGGAWSDNYGRPMDFDQIAHALLAMAPGEGCCGGTHVPHALMTLTRVDDEVGILDGRTRGEIEDYFRAMAAALEAAQSPDGGWSWSWAESLGGGTVQTRVDLYADPVIANMVVTGHHLEWMALAPSHLRPSPGRMRRAARAVVENWPQIVAAMAKDRRTFNPATHAARALRLLSGY